MEPEAGSALEGMGCEKSRRPAGTIHAAAAVSSFRLPASLVPSVLKISFVVF